MEQLPLPLLLFAVSVIFNLLSLLLIISVVLSFHKILGKEKTVVASDRKTKSRIAKKIEEQASLELEKIIKATSARLEEEIDKQLAKFSDSAIKQSQQLATFVQDQQQAVIRESQFMVANTVNTAQKELATYKENQLKKVNTEINQIVFAAAREVLGRAISLAEHEDLVSKALERAKKDKFFS